MPHSSEERASHTVRQFTESVIRDMTRLCMTYHGDEGVNLAQGFPDFPAPMAIKEAAMQAIADDINQYSVTWGTPSLRQAIATKVGAVWGHPIDPNREVTVCCGATEAMIATIIGTINRGDEVVVFAPFYENYGPDCLMAGAERRYVTLHAPDWHFDERDLHAAITPRTKAIIVNTPHNPTGKVFSRQELSLIANVCQEHHLLAITDEIYEHLVYEGEHISIATLPGMAERTVTISGLSKTFSVTGWRLGYVVAPPDLTDAIRKVHDFLTVAAPHPLQAAAVVALGLGPEYYASMVHDYRERRAHLWQTLTNLGLICYPAHGAYYLMTDISPLGWDNDVEFCQMMVRDLAVAAVPGSSFYHDPALGRTNVRWAYPKRIGTLERARHNLAALKH